jgi:hypothetical protein
MTHPANIIDMQLPVLTQFKALGILEPSKADPSTNRGNSEVNFDRI